MKSLRTILILLPFGLASIAMGQARSAVLIDLKGGEITPVVGTTIAKLPDLTVGKIMLKPELWALAGVGIPSGNVSLGSAFVLGYDLSPNYTLFGGFAARLEAKYLRTGIVAGIQIRF